MNCLSQDDIKQTIKTYPILNYEYLLRFLEIFIDGVFQWYIMFLPIKSLCERKSLLLEKCVSNGFFDVKDGVNSDWGTIHTMMPASHYCCITHHNNYK